MHGVLARRARSVDVAASGAHFRRIYLCLSICLSKVCAFYLSIFYRVLGLFRLLYKVSDEDLEQRPRAEAHELEVYVFRSVCSVMKVRTFTVKKE